MAAVGGIRQATATLVAATADTVTLTGGAGRKCELTHHGDDTTAAYFRTDGTAAVSAADENEVILAGERITFNLGDSGAFSIISAGTPTYTASVIS